MTRKALARVTAANDDKLTLTLSGATLTADNESRIIRGTVVEYGTLGYTSAGPLKVRAGALRFPAELSRVKLTTEHWRTDVVGYLSGVEDNDERLVATFKIAKTESGDRALLEAAEKVRDGLSIDAINVQTDGDEIVAADVIAVGHVTFPAFPDSRVDAVAANHHTKEKNMKCSKCGKVHAPGVAECEVTAAAEPTQETTVQTTATTATEPEEPTVLAGAALPGIPAGHDKTKAKSGESQLETFLNALTASMNGDRSDTVLAALNDVTVAQHGAKVSPESWTGELWSGLAYTQQFINLFNQGTLTSRKGKGWRFVVRPEVGDYAGNKANIPTNTPTTEPSEWTAERLAGGWDIDRAFYDFADTEFLNSFFQAAREDYAMKADFKVRDFIVENAVGTTDGTSGGTAIPAAATLIGAVATARKYVTRFTRAKATFVLVNDDDMDSLLTITEHDLPAFLKLFGITPENFVVSPDIEPGAVYAGVRQAATVRQLPGASPLRVSAQHIAQGGIDEALFGYIAVEQHHPLGIVKVDYTEPAAG